MSNKPNYKTSRKYKCPYCEYRAIRSDLCDHVDKKHTELIPEGYTSARAVYDSINGKNHGTCMSCKKNVYKWNDKINRYYNLCDDPKCRAKVREVALQRHMKVYNKPTLLNDADHQEKMLANRKISGSYTFSDGCKITYTGSYEKNALEFIDKVLQIPSKDIQAPGPVLEYKYGGKTHKWITDIYYIPGNLLIEVKDGGSNPNNRSMSTYREKQVAKEEMITNLGTFNYLRLTDNNFAQLLSVFADMKNEALESTNPKATVHINEEVGGLPVNRPPEAYVVPYSMGSVFDGYAYSDSELGNVIMDNGDGTCVAISESEFFNTYNTGPVMYYKGNDIREKMNEIHDIIKNNKVESPMHFAKILCGFNLRKPNDIVLSENFKYYDNNREKKIFDLLENGIQLKLYANTEDIVSNVGDNAFIHQTPKGYYASNSLDNDLFLASEFYMDIDDDNLISTAEYIDSLADGEELKLNGFESRY